MSDYEDDFEEGNDTFNDRTGKKTNTKPVKSSPKKPANLDSTGKGSNYDNTFARDNTIGIKTSNRSSVKNPLNNKPKGLSKQGMAHSSTPNLKETNHASKRSILSGRNSTNTHHRLTNYGLTKKAQQTIIPSKAMTLEQAEKLMEDAKLKIEQYGKEKQTVSDGNMDEKLEVSIKENKYLQKTLINMQDIINKLFEKYDPVKAPMKSYPQTDRIKSPPKSAQMKYRTKEVENAQHALDNMMVEYEKVSARMDLIKDPNFFSNLHAQLDEVNKEMKSLEKENKTLHTEQKKRELEMEKLLAQGAPDTMYQINDLQNKVTITKDQLRKEESESEEVEMLMQQVAEQEKELKQKEEKLREIGKKYDVNFDNTGDEKKQIEAEKLQGEKDTYGKHLAIAESATKVMRKKLKTMSKVNKVKLRELQDQKEEYEKELELKTQQVKIKNQEISELMEKNSDLQKVRQRDSNHFLGEEKNANGYDAVQRAIQEQDEKEAQAAIKVQSWCRVILAKKLANRVKQKNKEKPKRVQSSSSESSVRAETKKQVNQSKPVLGNHKSGPVVKKSNDAVFITKRDSVDKKISSSDKSSDDESEKLQNKQIEQKANLKKATSKPVFGKNKFASKPVLN